jgi:hypothetical protein
VRAIALIAAPRPRGFGTVADSFCSNKRRWLWAPAFAGATMLKDFRQPAVVVPAKRSASRDPYAAAPRFGTMADTFRNHKSRWLWAPAFAGATWCDELLRIRISNSSRQSQTRLRDLAASFARGLPQPSALRDQRARGMPGARSARSRACSVVNTRVSHHGHTGNHPAFPAQWFNGFLRALPGDRAFLSPSSRGNGFRET